MQQSAKDRLSEYLPMAMENKNRLARLNDMRDAAILALYWHSVTAPDSLAIAAMAAPWMVEFGAMATIKKHKITTPADDSQPDDENKGE